MAGSMSDILCSGNGDLDIKIGQFDSPGLCRCHRCYSGEKCEKVISSECRGTIELQYQYYHKGSKPEKCKCAFNQTGLCCEEKKCVGSNPIPDPETGKCNCSDPEIRSGEFCEKISCKNGVAVIRDGKCDCTGFDFTGKFCEKITCYGNGIPTLNATECLCKDRFSGPHCQYLQCDHNGRHSPYSSQCYDCMFPYKGDYCHEINGLYVAAIVVPAVILLLIIMLIARKCLAKKPYAAASSNDRNGASGPHQETSLFTNPAQPGTSNSDYSNRLIPSAPPTDRSMNDVKINFPARPKGDNTKSPEAQIGNRAIGIIAAPSSANQDPPSYAEAMEMFPSENDQS